MRFNESAAPVSDADLEALERRINRSVPQRYREFLQLHNGGYPEPGDFTIPGQGDDTVDSFLGVETTSASSDLEHVLRVYDGRVPGDLFPIARDPGGNLICLSVDPDESGRIYFWDHEEEADEGEAPTRRNLTLLSDNLDDFLKSLH